jgi:MFS family permease
MMPETGAGTRRTHWGAVLFLSVILFTSAGCTGVMAPLQQAAQIDLGLTDLQIATLQGGAHGLPALVCAIPLGLAIDHLNRARVMLVLALLRAGGSILTAYAHDFTTLFVARGLVALGAGAAMGVALSLIADLCPQDKRGRMTTIAGIGILAGPALAFAGGGGLFGYFRLHGWALFPGMAPWRLTAMAFAMMACALLVPIALFREPPRHERERHGGSIVAALRGLAERWRFLAALWVGSTAGGMAEGAAGLWAAPILTRSYGLQPDAFGGWMGGTIFLAGLIGSVIGGVAVDWGNKSGRRGGLMIGSIVATAIAIPATAYPIMPTVPEFGVMLGVMLCACTITQVAAVAAVTLVIPNEERGMCLAIISMIGTVVGMGSVPMITLLGPILFGDDQHLRQTLVVIGVATGAIGLAGYITAMRVAPRTWIHA